MRLENLLKLKYKKIEERAETEKAVVKYLIDLIENNHNFFVTIFNEEIEKKFKKSLEYIGEKIERYGYNMVKGEFFDNALYNEVEKTIKKVDEELTEVIGITFYNKKFNYPQISLGWAEYSSDNSQNIRETIKITEKGREIVDKYKKAQGFVDSKKQKEENIKKWDKVLQQT